MTASQDLIATTEQLILATYQSLSTKKQDWVFFRDLRPVVETKLGEAGVDMTLWKGLFIKAFGNLTRTGEVHGAPDSCRMRLTADDHFYAIVCAGEEQHWMAVEAEFLAGRLAG